MAMFQANLEDQLNRAVKLAMDSGEAATLEAATALFKGYRLGIRVGPDVAGSPTLQAAVLTAVNTARRCFLGGVEVVGSLDVPLLVPWLDCTTLIEAVADLQGVTLGEPSPSVPYLQVGDEIAGYNLSADRAFALRVTFNGWSGGVTPLGSGLRLQEHQECPPAGVLAGSLGVSEAFQHVRGGNPMAGQRDVGLSLWRPESDVNWLSAEAIGPPLEILPSKLWLIGLGHLGQAYLWNLGFLPYAKPGEVEFVLHDFDTLTIANDSTSPLTRVRLVGEKKTRAMAAWCEARGFRSVIIERRFDSNFRISNDEPSVALAGVDNALARAGLEDVGFRRVIEAGLGKGASEYLAFQIHTFPGPQTARGRWGRGLSPDSPSLLLQQPAYAALASDGLDECGLTLLAGRSVGASFVGTAVGSLVVAEAMRLAVGSQEYNLIDCSLRTPAGRAAIRNESTQATFNPGYTGASGISQPNQVGVLKTA